MSHRHKAKIEKIFEHPVSVNIDVKRLLSALEHYGCEVEVTSHGKTKITKNNEEFSLPMTHGHDLTKDIIVSLRHFLEKVGLTPANLE